MDGDGRKYLDLFLWIVLGVIVGTATFVVFLSGPAPAETPEAPTVEVPDVPEVPEPEVFVPPEVDVTIITYDDCPECNSTTYLMAQMYELEPNLNFTIGTVEEVAFDSPEGIELIEQYNIEKLPTMLISKEASVDMTFSDVWASGVGSIEDDGTFVFRFMYPPYYVVEDSSVHGRVEAYVISPNNCTECEDLNGFIDYLQGESVLMYFSNRTSLTENDTMAQELIAQYNITKLPTFLLSEGATEYPVFDEQLTNLMHEMDGMYVLAEPLPPYVDIESREVLGLVEVIHITDGSCTDCFDTESLVQSIVMAFGMKITGEVSYDVNTTEAQDLIEQYNISLVPTILISPEASAYPSFEEMWTSTDDSLEADGWYVYRSHALVQDLVYQDLNAPEIEEPVDVPVGNETVAGNETNETA